MSMAVGITASPYIAPRRRKIMHRGSNQAGCGHMLAKSTICNRITLYEEESIYGHSTSEERI